MLYFIGEYNCLIKLRTPEKECQILFVLVFLLYMFFKVLSNLQIEPYQFNNCLLKREEDNIKWYDKPLFKIDLENNYSQCVCNPTYSFYYILNE